MPEEKGEVEAKANGAWRGRTSQVVVEGCRWKNKGGGDRLGLEKEAMTREDLSRKKIVEFTGQDGRVKVQKDQTSVRMRARAGGKKSTWCGPSEVEQVGYDGAGIMWGFSQREHRVSQFGEESKVCSRKKESPDKQRGKEDRRYVVQSL